MGHESLDGLLLVPLADGLHGEPLVALDKADVQLAHGGDRLLLDGLNTVLGDVAGHLHHVVVGQEGDGALVEDAEDKGSSLLALHTLDAVQHDTRVAHALGNRETALLQHGTVGGARLDGHIAVLAELHVVQEDLEGLLGVGVDVHGLQLLHHFDVDLLDGHAASHVGLVDVGESLFAVVVVVQILIGDHARLTHHLAVEDLQLVDGGHKVVVGDELVHDLLPVYLYALDPGQVVEAEELHVHLLLGDPQLVAHTVLQAAGGVADADDAVVTRAVESLGDQTRGVGEVEDPCLGGVLLDELAVVHEHGDGADGHGEAAHARGLLSDDAVTKGHRLVHHAGVVAPHAQGGDDVVHATDSLYGVKDLADDQILALALDHVTAELADNGKLLKINIVEHDLVDVQLLVALEQAVDEDDGAHTRAADDSDFHMYVPPKKLWGMVVQSETASVSAVRIQLSS